MPRVIKLGVKRPVTGPLLPDPEPREVKYTLISTDDHLVEPLFVGLDVSPEEEPAPEAAPSPEAPRSNPLMRSLMRLWGWLRSRAK